MNRGMNIIIFSMVAVGVLLHNATASAAVVSFSPSEQLAKQEQPYTTTVLINTEGEQVNAVEGIIKIDPRVHNGAAIQLTDSGSLIPRAEDTPEAERLLAPALGGKPAAGARAR